MGKSSLINKLFNHKGLAKVSSTPGKTQTINFFDAQNVHFVDLPGYGFAKVPKSEKERWARLMDFYFTSPRKHALVCSLVDIRHDASSLDIDMIAYLKDLGLPFAVVLTKGDKVGTVVGKENARKLRTQLDVPEDVPMVITSSSKGTGIDELKEIIMKACD